MAAKRKQDEKHLKILRELASREHNKQCFDCNQRGPTYVNMTIGSFVCTSCSGILRGLNPPHRVKSISMASFTPQEIENLQKNGNENCRKTWLGLWDADVQPGPTSRDEQKVKDFLIQKYERKRWYVAPGQSPPTRAPTKQKQEEPKPPAKQEPKPLKSLLGPNAPSLNVEQNVQRKTDNRLIPPPNLAPVSSTNSPFSVQPTQSPASNDLLGDLGGDPFSSTTTTTQQGVAPSFNAFGDSSAQSSSVSGGFVADFSQAFGSPMPQVSQPQQPSQQADVSQSIIQNPLDDLFSTPLTLEGSEGPSMNAFASFPPPSQSTAPVSFDAFSSAPATQTSNQNSFTAFGSAPQPLIPASTASVSQASKSFEALSLSSSATSATSSTDRYKDLGSLFSDSSETSVFGTPSQSSSGFGGGPSASSNSSVFGTGGNSSGVFMSGAPSNSNSLFGGAPSTNNSVFGGAPSTNNSVFGGAPSANNSLFGGAPPAGSSGTSSSNVEANPFMTQTPNPFMMGSSQTSQANGFFGNQPPALNQGFGGPGMQPATSVSGFGSYGGGSGMPALQQGHMGMGVQSGIQMNGAMGAYGQVPAQQQGVNMGFGVQGQSGFGQGQGGAFGGNMQFNKMAGAQPQQQPAMGVGAGYGQMPLNQGQPQQFGTWNAGNSGVAAGYQSNPFLNQTQTFAPKAQSSNPFM